MPKQIIKVEAGKKTLSGKHLSRRRFLCAAGFGAAFPVPAHGAEAEQAPKVITVRGPVPASKLGVTLTHEHVMVDFIGADKVSRDRYDPEEVFRAVLPHLKSIYRQGCRTLIECTPAYLGRDVQLLERLSKAGGVRLLTNTGYYGAADDKSIPPHAYRETADQLAGRWIEEFRSGIEGTKIRPGFIKTGVDRGSLSPIDAKLVRAAAIAHRSTGLTIASHTGDGKAALEELDILREEGVAPQAFVWVHAQNEARTDVHLEAAARGAWISCDGIRPESLDRHLNLVRFLIDRGRIGSILISQDAGWYRVGEPGGGKFRPFDFLFLEFLPKLRQSGVSESQIRTIMVGNPARAFALGKRLLGK